MLIELELNTNDAEALLRHSDAHQPDSGDVREDSRWRDALETLACAVRERMSVKGTVDPRVLEAATAMFGNAAFQSNGCPGHYGLLAVNARSMSMQRKSSR
ncbi:hypothetical protein [Pseudomonas viridiflava]|uniref:hypothetical protein n=1 Tax=Pseudomonas viridiflava TaxID=33069 RepID=UPI00311CCBB0